MPKVKIDILAPYLPEARRILARMGMNAIRGALDNPGQPIFDAYPLGPQSEIKLLACYRADAFSVETWVEIRLSNSPKTLVTTSTYVEKALARHLMAAWRAGVPS